MMENLKNIEMTAQLLHVAEITLRRLIKRREISFHRIGHKYLFTEEDINQYLFNTAVPAKGEKSEYTP